MSHMLTVLKAYNESEFPGWREYDHAFCDDKMASTGVKAWTGMDMSLYQETLTIKKDEIRENDQHPVAHGCVFLYNGDGCNLKGCKLVSTPL